MIGGVGDTYTQCKLKCGDQEQVAWIPSEFAVPGQTLKLKSIGGDRDDGWVVSETYGTQSRQVVVEREQDARDYRQRLN